jgi:DNA-directed RNA polymerase specialized sigma24 family protein
VTAPTSRCAAADDPAGAAALAWLCERYWEPLRAHALRRGWRPDSAEDLVQQLLMEVIARRDLATVHRDIKPEHILLDAEG